MVEVVVILVYVEIEMELWIVYEFEFQYILDVDGYIFVVFENFVVIVGIMKDFYDCCYYLVFG